MDNTVRDSTLDRLRAWIWSERSFATSRSAGEDLATASKRAIGQGVQHDYADGSGPPAVVPLRDNRGRDLTPGHSYLVRPPRTGRRWPARRGGRDRFRRKVD